MKKLLIVVAVLFSLLAAGCILSGNHQSSGHLNSSPQINQSQPTPDIGNLDVNISDNLSEMDDIPDFQLDI